MNDSKMGRFLNLVIQGMLERHGRDLSYYDESFLSQSLEKRRVAAGFAAPEDYLERVMADGAEAEAVSCSLRVAYSEFFRNNLAFAVLEQVVMPRLLDDVEASGRGEVRVWSAGCASGQEAWSVAMLLDESITACARPLSYRIFATDQSEACLEQACAAIYPSEAVGNVISRRLGEYFSRQNGSCSIVPRLRASVDFSLYDLLDERAASPPASIFGGFDIVLCCNVLFYYRTATQRFILDRLRRCLTPGGIMIVGETERQIVENAGGFQEAFPLACLFRKTKTISPMES